MVVDLDFCQQTTKRQEPKDFCIHVNVFVIMRVLIRS
jgi:hypothetical protein